MIKYIGRKLMLAIPLVIGVATLIFLLLEASPGDVADKFFSPDTPPELRQMIVAQYGLDQPMGVRYVLMLKNLMMLDFGVSMDSGRPVFELVANALPNTLILSAVTLAIVFPVGIVLGTIQATQQNTLTDTSISVSSLFLYSMPGFWLAMMLQLNISYHFSTWIEGLAAAGTISHTMSAMLSIPGSGMYDVIQYDDMSPLEQILNRAKHLILPGLAMAVASAAGTARYMRSSLLEVIRQDYIRTARAKGLRERQVIVKHGMRNAMLPIVTLFGLSIPFLFSGSVLIEMIFAWPGIGRLIVNAIYAQDTPLIIACFFVSTLLVVAGNLIADVTYAIVDPRITFD